MTTIYQKKKKKHKKPETKEKQCFENLAAETIRIHSSLLWRRQPPYLM